GDGVPAGEVLAALVVLDRGGPPAPAVRVAVTPDEGGHRITVTWPDAFDTTVTLPAPAGR
ncbi:hypothetical protein AB0M71_26390, partial [Amycolatopsis sp. NPDC051114]